MHASKSAVVELLRIAWRTVGAIVARVGADSDLHVDRLEGLRRIGIDEISYTRGHRYLRSSSITTPAGLRHLGFHDLRRFMETYGQALGYSVAQVAMRAGHDPSVAARHSSGRVHETDRQLAAAVATLLVRPGES